MMMVRSKMGLKGMTIRSLYYIFLPNICFVLEFALRNLFKFVSFENFFFPPFSTP